MKRGKKYLNGILEGIRDVLEKFFEPNQAEDFLKEIRQKPSLEKQKKPGLKKQRDFQLGPVTSENIRHLADRFITFAQERLSKEKYLDFLLSLGKLAITQGEFSLASEIHTEIISKAKDDERFGNIAAYGILALGEIFSRQAMWKESLRYINQAGELFSKQKDLKGSAMCQNLMGTIYGDKGELKRAKAHFEKSQAYLNPKKDKVIMSMIDINLGIINNIQGNLDAAYTHYRRALMQFEEIGDWRKVAEVRHNLGMLFTHRKEYSSAIKEFDSSINVSIEARYLPTVTVSYLSKGYIYSELNDLELANAYADKGLELGHQLNDRLSLADGYKIKGIIARKRKNYNESENYLLTSLRMNKEYKNYLNHAETSFELGLLYLELQKKDDARKHFKNALSYYRKIGAAQDVSRIKAYLDSS